MSSHHIVREKQEPALLIISLIDFDQEYLGQLLEWSPFIIVSEAAYEHADSLGIKIDAVISSHHYTAYQPATRLIPAGMDVLEDGLKFLVSEQFPSVNVLTDSFSVKDFVLFADKIDLVIYSESKKIFPVNPGFSKWKVGGEHISLMHEVNHLRVSGLFHLSEHVLETEKDGFFTLVFDQPFLFIGEDV